MQEEEEEVSAAEEANEKEWDLNVSARVSLRQDSFERKEG